MHDDERIEAQNELYQLCGQLGIVASDTIAELLPKDCQHIGIRLFTTDREFTSLGYSIQQVKCFVCQDTIMMYASDPQDVQVLRRTVEFIKEHLHAEMTPQAFRTAIYWDRRPDKEPVISDFRQNVSLPS